MKKHQVETSVEAESKSDQPRQFKPDRTKRSSSGGPTYSSALASAPISEDRFPELMVAHHDRGSNITEEYRALRTHLLAQCPDEKFCYLVTSAEAGEGKTVTCMNLAMVLAERTDRRTILVDCDLRKKSLSRLVEAEASPGVAELLRATTTTREVVQPTANQNLFFLPAGQAEPQEVAELIGRVELNELINELRRQYDYVIIDTPPVNIVSDAGMLGRATGEALMVVKMNKTRRESVEKAIRIIRAANVKLAGVVLTHRQYHIPNCLYKYA